jgi:5-methyltetrahydropteroyltriglutamate--homocysteine methyltransferase
MSELPRAHVVGSMLRPDYLRRAQAAAGEASDADNARLRDRAVAEAIEMQERAGIDVVTDGEMGRDSFIDYLFSLGGLKPLTETPQPIEEDAFGRGAGWRTDDGPGERPLMPQMVAVEPLTRPTGNQLVEQFTLAQSKATKPVKVTLPSPTLAAMLWSPRYSIDTYRDPFELFADVAEIIRSELSDLASAGCVHVQLDAPDLTSYVDPEMRAQIEARGGSLERMLDEGLAIIDSAGDVSGLNVGIHLCRGNYRGQWLAQGGYEAISRELFTRLRHFKTFLLEYDSPRAGSFEALADVPEDKQIVLGVVSTKRAKLEDKEWIAQRVKDASRYVSHEQLAISPQCGFSSDAVGGPLDESAQEAKLQLVATLARELWS